MTLGTTEEMVLSLTLKEPRRIKAKIFGLVDYRGRSALDRNTIFLYPLIPYIEIIDLKKERNQSAEQGRVHYSVLCESYVLSPQRWAETKKPC